MDTCLFRQFEIQCIISHNLLGKQKASSILPPSTHVIYRMSTPAPYLSISDSHAYSTYYTLHKRYRQIHINDWELMLGFGLRGGRVRVVVDCLVRGDALPEAIVFAHRGLPQSQSTIFTAACIHLTIRGESNTVNWTKVALKCFCKQMRKENVMVKQVLNKQYNIIYNHLKQTS